jgi:hypothetical protein
MWSLRPFIEGKQHWLLSNQTQLPMLPWRVYVTYVNMVLNDWFSENLDGIAKEEAAVLLAQILKGNAYMNWSRVQRYNHRKWISLDEQREIAILAVPLSK